MRSLERTAHERGQYDESGIPTDLYWPGNLCAAHPGVTRARLPEPSVMDTHAVNQELNLDPSQAGGQHDALDRFAVPVGNRDHGYGTAFLGRSKGRVALYTAGHNLGSGVHRKCLTIDAWRWLAPAIEVHSGLNPTAASLDLVIFVSPGAENLVEERRPSFDWVSGHSAGTMMDAVRFTSADVEDLVSSEQFAIADLDTAVHDVATGDRLTCVGFPPNPETDIWPYRPPARDGGTYATVVDQHLQANFQPSRGFSGGPVFVDDGRLAGMLVGIDHRLDGTRYTAMARIVPARVLVDLSGPH